MPRSKTVTIAIISVVIILILVGISYTTGYITYPNTVKCYGRAVYIGTADKNTTIKVLKDVGFSPTLRDVRTDKKSNGTVFYIAVIDFHPWSGNLSNPNMTEERRKSTDYVQWAYVEIQNNTNSNHSKFSLNVQMKDPTVIYGLRITNAQKKEIFDLLQGILKNIDFIFKTLLNLTRDPSDYTSGAGCTAR